MTTITEFLLARIAEDEALTRSLWMSYCDGPEGIRDGVVVMDDYFGAAELVVGYNRMLAECAAKRAIVERETAGRTWKPGDRQPPQRFISASEPLPEDVAAWRVAHTVPVTDTPTLRLLAAVYADHPDYRQEWKP